MTVSRVLRNKGDVSEATRQKVQEAAKRLGYVPNKIAGALASSSVNLVAVIIPSLGNMVFPIDACVGISHRRAGRKMAEAIIDAGYKRIGFMGTKMPLDHRARKRFEGFTRTLAKSGIEIADQEFYSGGSALVKGREMTASMLQRTPDLDFLYYSNDMIGAGGMMYLLEQGVDIPNQIGLAGFNGVELLDGLSRQLATMDACRSEIGEAAASLIIQKRTSASADLEKFISLKPKLSYGETLLRK